jgi:hypothetical protein
VEFEKQQSSKKICKHKAKQNKAKKNKEHLLMQSAEYSNESYGPPNAIPNIVKGALVVLFALLWAIWIQPHTIALRYLLLTTGSILGLYAISKNLALLKTRSAAPIYLIGLLFVWITFHLFFLSHQYVLQLEEYLTIWKRIALGAPFAIGLGIVMQGMRVGNMQNLDAVEKHAQSGAGHHWWIFYAGMCTPTVIYLVRAASMYLAGKFGWHLPNGLMNLYPPSTWYIPKTGYVFFCLPALALACSRLLDALIKAKQNSTRLLMLYGSTIAAVLTVFYFENIKNGIAYSAMLILATVVKLIATRKTRLGLLNSALILTGLVAVVLLLTQHFQKNDSWKTLFSDIKVAEHLDEIDSWKYYGGKGYPMSELGKPVSDTNYERAAWSQVAFGFIGEVPLGYGLVEKSFGGLAREKWPDSKLLQSHSGWLDLTLGVGIPGVFLLLLAGVLSLKNVWVAACNPWGSIALWILLSIALLMITTEVSQRTYIDALIFLILWVTGLGLRISLPKPVSSLV